MWLARDGRKVETCVLMVTGCGLWRGDKRMGLCKVSVKVMVNVFVHSLGMNAYTTHACMTSTAKKMICVLITNYCLNN